MSHPPHKRVWIVGARGFLGSVLQGLVEGALLIDPACREGEEGIASCVQAAGVAARAVETFGAPDVVYFCAATHGGDAAAYRRAYLEPVQAVAAVAPQARLVFCSSTAVYEGRGVVSEEIFSHSSSPPPASSTSPPSVRAEKLRVLLQAEQAVLQTGGVVARLAPLYGSGRCELLRRHLAGEPRLPGPPERMLNYLHVEDAARALLALGTAPRLKEHLYNVCGETFTKAQAYELLEQLTGVPASRETSIAGRRGSSDHRVLAERIREVYEPRMRFASFVQTSLNLNTEP